ncbi:hypothetical protein CKAH01_03666 [Colletotrichum kahawae]|uniref:Uncharacterized protein n=1 Tax=Colletotrichum kahawae TaxID=34407 RepID=A0AAD9YNV2_COLKA|nr:hypothetical protein CKAH01_03666 [Colletotrichum kahawae]
MACRDDLSQVACVPAVWDCGNGAARKPRAGRVNSTVLGKGRHAPPHVRLLKIACVRGGKRDAIAAAEETEFLTLDSALATPSSCVEKKGAQVLVASHTHIDPRRQRERGIWHWVPLSLNGPALDAKFPLR